jgi:hypothetical protein
MRLLTLAAFQRFCAMRWRNEKSEGIARRVGGWLGSWILHFTRVPLLLTAHAARNLSTAAPQEVRNHTSNEVNRFVSCED